jgi:polysaccharide pyruvyl transferase CsaB
LRYLISGYYGEKNVGDEAILSAIMQEIERRDPEAHFTVLSFHPDDTEWRHRAPGRRLETLQVSLRTPLRLRAAIRASDLLISGGGGFLHEADFATTGRSFLLRDGKLRPVPHFLSVVLAAKAERRPVMWYAQGLGPLHTHTARRLVGAVGSVSQIVTWRDRGSASLAYETGVRAPVQLVVPDPAYAITPAPPEEAAEWLAFAGITPGTPYLVVCPRYWMRRRGYLENLGEVLEEVRAALDLEIVLIAFHEVQDLPICESLAARPGLAGHAHVPTPAASPALLAAVLGAAELVVAMRLHSGILAAVAGTPAVVVDYDPKTLAFAAQTGQSRWAVNIDDLEARPAAPSPAASRRNVPSSAAPGAERLAQAILDTAAAAGERRAALARAVEPLRTEAGRTAQLAVQLASRGHP